jgi:hypothetical protein
MYVFKEINMKRLLQVSFLVFCIPFLCGFLFGSKPKKVIYVLEITKTGDVIIDANDRIAKPKMTFDIFKTNDNKGMLVARIMITKTTPANSTGTIISKTDGSKAKISDISKGMLCRETSKQTLEAEKKIYKKTLADQAKLMKLKNAKYQAKLKDWIGSDINKLIASWGPPKAVVGAPNGENRVYVYSQNPAYKPTTTDINSVANNAVTDDDRAVQQGCNTYFETDDAGKIIKYEYRGNNCQ